ncbi:ArsR family transcriptional regulator [Duganella vulcania]|uniref:ArsR family transcriptional regulator n=1 Tax=Duganella vulcania TaxID=2692166 RepID=A0A845GI70_9BURK|nr:ArsR family transcriptional regulator [Duganella vulcania]MYM92369.1 ArsR family transcriptional regulator [Duganella vulcania]
MNTSHRTALNQLMDDASTVAGASNRVDSSQYSFAGLNRLNVGLRQPTSARLEKMQSLVTQMQGREMSLYDIQRFLKFSDTGAKKYVTKLREVGIVEALQGADGTATTPGRQLFKVTADPARLKAGFASLAEKVKKAASRSNTAVKSRLGKDDAGNARRFHILADDEDFAVKLSRHRPVRDPLVAALFGPATPAGTSGKAALASAGT